MDITAVLVVMAAIFLWGSASARLERAALTAPIVFVVVGGVLAATDLVAGPSAPETLKPIVELTLVLVLFSDAARIPLREVRRDIGGYARLLGIGLPLIFLVGWGLAALLFPGLGIWLAALVAAALAPTDAALGVPVVTNPVVPARVRRLITVESGLNDGLATPVVWIALAGAAVAGHVKGASDLQGAVTELLIGTVIGGAVGVAGGWLLRQARRRGWAAEDFAGIAVLSLAVAAYSGAITAGGNGFIAAFCGGIAFGAVAGRRGPAELEFLEQFGGLATLLVWLAFGVIAVPIMFDRLDVVTVLYAVLSLTVVRMVPVALASIGSGFDRETVLFIGWFGPRGLASLVFALIAIEQLGRGANQAVVIIAATVLLSVLAHGLTAGPVAARYGAAVAAKAAGPEEPVEEIPVRGLPGGKPRPRAAVAVPAPSGDLPMRQPSES